MVPSTPTLPRPQSPAGRWGLVVGVGILLIIVYWLRLLLLPFALAGGLACIAAPARRWLEDRARMPHPLAALLVYLLVLAILVAGGSWIQWALVPQIQDVAARLPGVAKTLVAQVCGGEKIAFGGQVYTAEEVSRRALAALGSPQQILPALGFGVEVLTGLILTLVLLCYFLFDSQRMAQGLLWLTPPSLRPAARTMAREINPILGRYLRGLLMLLLYATVVSWIGLGLVLRWPNALLLAVLVGILEMMPGLGPVISTILLGVLGLRDGNLWVLGSIAVFTTAMRASIDLIVGPLVLGRTMRLHPVVVMFALIAGGVLMGVLGVLIAIPAAAVMKLVLERCYGESELPITERDFAGIGQTDRL